MLDERAEFEQLLADVRAGRDPVDAASKRLESAEEGYSSIEVPEKQSAAEATSSEAEGAEPNFEAADAAADSTEDATADANDDAKDSEQK